ncbi:MAG: hypothetical protein K9J12_05380 [Melioribacteraceae bacterium]|nr:hypothetical protein [Melioribacteraceae bacterium]MCF8266235.1 hypothetical protein [Melioribacteraceae bacterium]
MNRKIIALFIIILISSANLYSQGNDLLQIESDYEVGQIEVGGPFVGIEIHKSFPMINRISFYYPVANSIDISQDYWKRENYRIMSMGMKVGTQEKFMLENEPWKVIQSPYDVEFQKEIENTGISIKYEFCISRPAMVSKFSLTNNSDSIKSYELFLSYEAVIRTSHTYNLIDNGKTKIGENGRLVTVTYDTVEAGHSQIFFNNVGDEPTLSAANYNNNTFKSASHEWLNSEQPFLNDNKSKPTTSFIYKKELKPGESLNIIQLIGSVKIDEADEVISYLSENYKKEIEDYKEYVLTNSVKREVIKTGDPNFDFTTDWALGVLATNNHYIDSNIAPMPAQAEYNFYFTHDVLVTDLAVVNYDLERVKNDLEFIISLANEDHVIPHAYYWKDTEYRTEFADHDNWNNFWINIVAASYLRHSDDKSFVEKLYPYLSKSIETALLTIGDDSLMWSFRPDWWDIGKLYGPKVYMTALAARTIEDYIFISTKLGLNIDELGKYEKLATGLKDNMIQKLWSDEYKFLMNYYESGKLDPHYYIGSLVPAYMGMLDHQKTTELLTTAKKNMVDEKVGIYNAFPMDFHTLGDYLKFSGNEAGDVYYYFNGGIWPQGNAWYTLALIRNGQKDEALNFIKNVMTLDGLINGPNGQPAMYEVRNGNKSNSAEYGKVDKPQFMWAGAWYLNCLYNLLFINNDTWNITFDPYLPKGTNTITGTLYIAGNKTDVEVSGSGEEVGSVYYDGVIYPSLVYPSELEKIEKVQINLGETKSPIVTASNSILNSAELSNDKLLIKLSAFSGHENRTEIISPWEPKSIQLNSVTSTDFMSVELDNDLFRIQIEFKHNSTSEDIIEIKF